MFSIINKTREVVLCRFNSGIEFNLGPLATTERADSEVRDNHYLEKLVRLGVIDKERVKVAASPRSETGHKPAKPAKVAATQSDDMRSLETKGEQT